MRRKRLLVLVGSTCLVLILAVLPVMAGCKGAEEIVEEKEEEEEVAPELEVIKAIEASGSPATSEGSQQSVKLMEMWDEACRPLGYKIDCDFHFGGEIFPGSQAIEALSAGSIQIGGTMSYAAEGFEPRFSIFAIPLLWGSHDHVVRFHHTPEWQKVVADHEADGCKIIALTSWTFLWLGFLDREVHTLEDISGMRIRVMQSPIMVKTIELLGANPVAIVAAEVAVAMQTHMMEGMLCGMDPGYIKMLGYLDYLKSALDFPFTLSPNAKAVNTEWWYSLPDEVREALEGIIPDWEEESFSIRRRTVEEAKDMFRDAIPVTILSEAEFAKWMDAIKPIRDEVGDKIGHELIEAALRTR